MSDTEQGPVAEPVEPPQPAPEQPAEQQPAAEPTPQPAPEGAYVQRLRGRVDIQEAELARLKEENQRLRTGALSGAHPVDVEAVRAQTRQEDAIAAANAAYNAACNQTFQHGVQEFGNTAMRASVKTLNDAFGRDLEQRRYLLEAINDVEHGHRVYHQLAQDLDQMAELVAMPPAKAIVQIAKLAHELSKPGARAVSRAPAPITPITSVTRADGSLYDPKVTTSDWIALRDKQIAEKRRNR